MGNYQLAQKQNDDLQLPLSEVQDNKSAREKKVGKKSQKLVKNTRKNIYPTNSISSFSEDLDKEIEETLVEINYLYQTHILRKLKE